MTATPNPTAERWREKPVEIEARRFSGAMELIDVEGLALWCGGTFKHDTGAGQEYKTYYWSIEIPTLEGTMRATPGDYIIRGVQGEFYPCKPDIFEQTYERAVLVAAQGAGVAPQEPKQNKTKLGQDFALLDPEKVGSIIDYYHDIPYGRRELIIDALCEAYTEGRLS